MLPPPALSCHTSILGGPPFAVDGSSSSSFLSLAGGHPSYCWWFFCKWCVCVCSGVFCVCVGASPPSRPPWWVVTLELLVFCFVACYRHVFCFVRGCVCVCFCVRVCGVWCVRGEGGGRGEWRSMKFQIGEYNFNNIL